LGSAKARAKRSSSGAEASQPAFASRASMQNPPYGAYTGLRLYTITTHDFGSLLK
jgi:hypothetical protein